jgi:hypothetical protein
MNGGRGGTLGVEVDYVRELGKLGSLIHLDSHYGNFAVIAVTAAISEREAMEGELDRQFAPIRVIDGVNQCDVVLVPSSLSVMVRRYVQENVLSAL